MPAAGPPQAYVKKKGRVIFVCSMADLFGEWVPDEWIRAVFEACAEAPQHKYLFLTKNPARYEELEKRGELPASDNMWYGYSYTGIESARYWSEERNVFISMEPLLKPVEVPPADWVIIGAETGRRKEKVGPVNPHHAIPFHIMQIYSEYHAICI